MSDNFAASVIEVIRVEEALHHVADQNTAKNPDSPDEMFVGANDWFKEMHPRVYEFWGENLEFVVGEFRKVWWEHPEDNVHNLEMMMFIALCLVGPLNE